MLVLGCVDCGCYHVKVVVCLWFLVCGLWFDVFVFDFFYGGIWSFILSFLIDVVIYCCGPMCTIVVQCFCFYSLNLYSNTNVAFNTSIITISIMFVVDEYEPTAEVIKIKITITRNPPLPPTT